MAQRRRPSPVVQRRRTMWMQTVGMTFLVTGTAIMIYLSLKGTR